MNEESAKAVQEVAKTGHKALEVAEKSGGWFAQFFEGGMRHLGAAFEDSMQGFRIRNRAKVLEKTHTELSRHGLLDNYRTLENRIAGPLIEAISLEDDETLQDVWARFIRNSSDPEKPKANRTLIEVIKNLEPVDWPLIERLFSAGEKALNWSDLASTEAEIIEAMDRLAAIGLFHFEDDNTHYLTLNLSGKQILTIKVSIGAYEKQRTFDNLREAVS